MQNEMVMTYIDHMNNPRNYGKLEVYDGAGIGKNPDNGEAVIVYFRLREGVIEEIAYQVKACSTTVVSASIFTETLKGVDLEEAKVLSSIMLEKLDEQPPEQAACSEIVTMAFLAALEHYEQRQSDPEAMIVTKYIEKSCVEPGNA
jgi:nitrogen fixation NifU-like protein